MRKSPVNMQSKIWMTTMKSDIDKIEQLRLGGGKEKTICSNSMKKVVVKERQATQPPQNLVRGIGELTDEDRKRGRPPSEEGVPDAEDSEVCPDGHTSQSSDTGSFINGECVSQIHIGDIMMEGWRSKGVKAL